MMKKIIILYTFLISVFVSAQQTVHFDISWKDVKMSTSRISIVIPGFDRQNLDYQEGKGIKFTAKWKESLEINSQASKIENIVYQNISQSELKDLDVNLIPKELSYTVSSVNARNKRSGYVSISPIIRSGNTFKKIVSFDVRYQTTARKSVSKRFPISNSVLASGDWFRFYVEKTGIFRITPAFLSDLGINLSGVNPATIKIYGNGGQMMPLLNQDNTELDLRENAIQLVGGEDGVFSGDDYILLYGEAADADGYNEENMSHINLYDNKSYYYVTTGGSNGRRVSNYVAPTGNADIQINSFTDYQFWEEDEFNVVKLGRRWFGDRFDVENTRDYVFDFPNLITLEPVKLSVFGAATSSSSSRMNVSVNGAQVGVLNFGQIGGNSLGSARNLVQDVVATSDRIRVNLVYDNNANPSATGYLDFISLEAQRALIATDVQMPFFYKDASTLTGIGQYTVSNTSGISQIWDVTNPSNITRISNDGGASTISFKALMGESRQYTTVVPSDYFNPMVDQTVRVDNQDIKGTIFLNDQGQFADIDYLIISNNLFLQAANRLADHHRTMNNYNVKVIGLDQIYHEFGSGKQDVVAIRNLIRYVYENASSPDAQIKYACFLGDASVDYKGLLIKENCPDSNIVPTFQSLESFSLTDSFATDDFFGSMDPEEGRMVTGDRLDIAVGRILANSPQEADVMVSKILDYSAEASYGRWRNSILLVADDVDVAWEERIQRELDELGDELVERKPFFNLSKIYVDAFQQESSASGDRYPKVNELFSTAIETGAVLVNFFGHGGEDGLAKEFIFNKSDATSLINENKLPVFITVTCEFTKFDNPCRDTAGEFMFTNPAGGAIALISTTRDVFVQNGKDINDSLSQFLFPDGSDYPTVGEAVRLLKNSRDSNKRRVVVFFGDPAMKMAVPTPDIRLTQINDTPVTQEVDVLKALSKVKISGEVVNESGTLLSDYNGVLSTTIYDKQIDRVTLANDGVRVEGELIKHNFKTLGAIIFRGKASVTNGVFDFEFVVPRDIGIPEGNGRISFYASRNGALEDQTGVDQTIVVGGLNENAPEDNVGPQIQLFMNDENFVSGGVTNDAPILIAKLQDENGINTASGIGHDIAAVLDGDEANPFILNDFYETEIDDFTKGIVNFKFRDLEPGLHTLTFKGWDVYNNSSTQEIQFVVAEAAGFTLNNVLNYPNPFVSHTEFWFEHSGAVSDLLDVQIQVFTVSGKVIWTKNQTLSGKTSYQEDIQWDGKDDFGDKLGKGVYVYKISVKSTLTNQRVEKFEKLVIL